MDAGVAMEDGRRGQMVATSGCRRTRNGSSSGHERDIVVLTATFAVAMPSDLGLGQRGSAAQEVTSQMGMSNVEVGAVGAETGVCRRAAQRGTEVTADVGRAR